MTDAELAALLDAIDYSTRDPETGDDLYPGTYVHLSVEDAIGASVAIRTLRAMVAEAVVKERERCARVGYVMCAKTRHVTLGNEVAAAIRAGKE